MSTLYLRAYPNTTVRGYRYTIGPADREQYLAPDAALSMALRHGIQIEQLHRAGELPLTSEPPDELVEPVDELENYLRSL